MCFAVRPQRISLTDLGGLDNRLRMPGCRLDPSARGSNQGINCPCDRGSSSVVEHLVANERVAGSNLVSRSRSAAFGRLFYFYTSHGLVSMYCHTGLNRKPPLGVLGVTLSPMTETWARIDVSSTPGG